MSVVLVTGGAGFIGSHISRELSEMGHKVIVLDDLSGGFLENASDYAEVVVGSVNDYKLVDDLFITHKFEYVFHCAAYAAEVLSHHIRRFNYNNNVVGSMSLINAAVNYGVKCFVFMSSAAVYGNAAGLLTEDSVPMPTDPYGIAKLAVELDLKAANEMFGLPYIIYRLHNVYGENQNIGDKYRNVIGIFMNQMLKGSPLTIFGDGTQTRSFTYVKDISTVIALSIHMDEAYNKILNLGSSDSTSINQLAAMLAHVYPISVGVEYYDSRHEVHEVALSHELANVLFGELVTQTLLEDGLKSMMKWVVLHGSRSSKDFDNIEIARNMPKSWTK